VRHGDHGPVPEAEELLALMAKKTGRTPSDIAHRALLDAMEDYEDAEVADASARSSTSG